MNLTTFGILIGLVIVILAIALWQIRKAVQAQKSFSQALEELPLIVLAAIRLISKINREESTKEIDLSEPWHGAINFVDVNNDGQRELLLQYPAGAHGSALRIFIWRNLKFEESARLDAGTPVGFEYGDFDGDGRIEIKTQETDWSAGLPYVSAPRLVLLLRWNGREFAKVSGKSSTVNE